VSVLADLLLHVEQSAQQDIVDDTPLYDKSQQQKFSKDVFKGFS